MKKLVTTLLAVVMLVSLLAPALADEVKPAAGGTIAAEPFAERVKITVPVYDRSKEGYPAVDDNYWTQWVQSEFGDKYNIDVEYVAIPRGDVMTKYALLIAADETPTIMMEYDYPKVAQWASDGAMQPIDLDAFAEVAPTYYQSMVDNNQLGYSVINDENYFVLSERPYYNVIFAYVTLYRQDWLDEMGIAAPMNYAEYVAAVEAVKEKYAPVPLGLGIPKSSYVANFAFRDFPVDEAEWAMHSSLGTPSFSWYPTYRLLKRQNAEYNKGFYSTEYELDQAEMAGTGGASKHQTDFINGEAFSYGGYISSNMAWLTAFFDKNPDAKLGVLHPNVVVEEGVADYPQFRADNPFGMIVGFSSLATEDQLKAAWMYLEWLAQPETLAVMENGIEGETYTVGEDGLPVVDGDYRGEYMLNHNNNIDMTCAVHASKKLGTIEQTIEAMSPQGLPQNFTPDLIDNYYNMKAIADQGLSYSDPVFAVAIEAESEYNATLLSLFQEYSVLLTKCAPEEFDDLYAELNQKYLDAGYQEIIDERLAAYEAGQTTKLPVAP